MLQTEHEFTLPLGFVDTDGNLHREGVMRLATGADEILPLADPRVVRNPAYLSVILLSRVVTRLGSLEAITPKTIESLFAADLECLQQVYNTINRLDGEGDRVTCPACRHEFAPERERLGGIVGYPLDRLSEEMAFIAYHFHWPLEDLMGLEHAQRRGWTAQISAINERIGG